MSSNYSIFKNHLMNKVKNQAEACMKQGFTLPTEFYFFPDFMYLDCKLHLPLEEKENILQSLIDEGLVIKELFLFYNEDEDEVQISEEQCKEALNKGFIRNPVTNNVQNIEDIIGAFKINFKNKEIINMLKGISSQ